MRDAQVIKMNVPNKIRTKILVEGYSSLDPAFLKSCIEKISKKLGGQHTKEAIEALEQKNYVEVVKITLYYYDKTYSFGQDKRDREKITEINLKSADPVVNAKAVMNCLTTELKRVK